MSLHAHASSKDSSATFSPTLVRSNLLQRKCACGGSSNLAGGCEGCKEKNNEAQRKAVDHQAANLSVPPIVNQVLRSPGQPLDAETRAFFEPRFGHDFSRVRVHTDSAAIEAAQSVHALAYTVGQHITMGTRPYQPRSSEGMKLLAHELTHTIQQGDVGNFPASTEISVGSTGSTQEGEADAAERNLGFSSTRPGIAATPLGIAASLQRKKWDTLPVYEERPEIEASCASTYDIPDNVYNGIGEAWKKSGHGGDTVAERGGRIVTDKAGKSAIRPAKGGSGEINYPEKAGDVTEGTYHTHPYSKAEGSHLGVAFSGGDIENFVGGTQGSVKYVGAGSCYFVLDTASKKLRDACKTEDVKKRWNDHFKKATGTFQEKVQTSVSAAIAGCGLCFYKTCRKDNKSAVPKTANLV
jgi:hypothetical protein